MKLKIFVIGTALIALMLLAGIYRFNFTDNDIYITQSDGHVIPYNKHQPNEVMLKLFSLKTTNPWIIALPESEVKVALTQFVAPEKRPYVTGVYQSHDEYGEVALDYSKITPLEFESSSNQMVFAAPFLVSNQGSGVFWYLGLFNLNIDSAQISQIDTYFLGDRIQLEAVSLDEPFDVTSTIVLNYFEHSDQQSMVEKPNQKVEKSIKVSVDGF